MAKLSSFIIMLVVFMVAFSGGIAMLLSELNDKYPGNMIGYNNSSLAAYNKLTDINTQTEEIKNSSTKLKSESGVLDVLGGFFEAAYGTLKIAAQSFGIFSDLSDQALDDTGLDQNDIIKKGAITIVMIIIFLGIIIAAVIKRDT